MVAPGRIGQKTFRGFQICQGLGKGGGVFGAFARQKIQPDQFLKISGLRELIFPLIEMMDNGKYPAGQIFRSCLF